MNITETGELLARIQVHDNRQIGVVTIEEWQHDLAEIDYADALAAVREHRRTSTDYLTANHVIQGVRRIRRDRTAGIDDYRSTFPGDPDDVSGELAWWRASIKRVADGHPPEEVFTMPALVSRKLPAIEGAFRRVPHR